VAARTGGRSAGVSGVAVTFVALGAYLAYAGIRNVPVLEGLRELLKGSIPTAREPVDSGIDWEGQTEFTPGTAKEGGTVPRGTPGAPVAIGATTVVAGTSIRVHTSIAANVLGLILSARTAGINLNGWGWRSTADQARLRRTNGCTCSDRSNCCSPPTAPVGRSMHERGLAIDFTSGGRTISSGSAAFRWLQANASKFGLRNLPSEPWHWSTTGT
jgi:hypothetical protein